MSIAKPLYLSEESISKLLNWQSLFEAIEQSLISVADHENEKLSNSVLSPRTFTKLPDKSGVLLTMPGFLGNYELPSIAEPTTKYNTLACKLLTKFKHNSNLEIPLPSLFGTIFLFEHTTGKLQCILEGTTITEWRTAAASLVATKYLYFNRAPSNENNQSKILSIIGCGAQGRIHGIAMLKYFNFSEIRLWNRTNSKAENLMKELVENFPNKLINVFESVEECVKQADVIVTATFTDDPLIYSSMLKENCHINAVGAGQNHYSELSGDLYEKSQVYVASSAGAREELKGFETEILGQVGDVICNLKPVPMNGITIFQSIGMSLYDAAAGQMVYEKYLISNL